MNLVEDWRPVKGYDGTYEVSNQGRVRSLNRTIYRKDGKVNNLKGRLLRSAVDRGGYYMVGLSSKSNVTSYLVHRLVATAFVHNPGNLPCVCHRDDNRFNNRENNLFWGLIKTMLMIELVRGDLLKGQAMENLY